MATRAPEIGARVTLVGTREPEIGDRVTLVGTREPEIGARVTLVATREPEIGDPLTLVATRASPQVAGGDDLWEPSPRRSVASVGEAGDGASSYAVAPAPHP